MGFFNLFKKDNDPEFRAVVHLPILEIEPITLLSNSIKRTNNFDIDRYIDYEYSSSIIYAELFDTFLFRVFSNSVDIESSAKPQINLTARIKQSGIQNIGGVEKLVNTINLLLNANEPFTEVDLMRIIDGVWRGRSYFIDQTGKIDSSSKVGSYLLTIELIDKEFTLSLICYNYFKLSKVL